MRSIESSDFFLFKRKLNGPLTHAKRKSTLKFLISCLCTITLFIFSISSVHAQTIEGRIVRITDGDTLILLDASNRNKKIRLSGIDAPEKGQPFGKASKKALSDLVFGKKVTAECVKLDRYQRNVCKILVDGLDINLEQIRKGFAWHYKKYEEEQPLAERTIYSQAENNARATRLGLWSDNNPQAPWAFRHEKILAHEQPSPDSR